MDDAVNVDSVASTNPDIVHDLNIRPWPFAQDRFRAVHLYDVLEHLDNVVTTLEEIHRVSRNGAHVFITVPHFSSSNTFSDPTHQHAFGVRSLQYFTGGNEFSFYSQVRFKSVHSNIILKPSLLNKFVSRIANKWSERYEDRWAWIWPAWFIFYQLEVLK